MTGAAGARETQPLYKTRSTLLSILAAALVTTVTLVGCGGSGKYEGLTEQQAGQTAINALLAEDQAVSSPDSQDPYASEPILEEDLSVVDVRKAETPFGKPAWSVVLSDTDGECFHVWLWDTTRYYIRGC